MATITAGTGYIASGDGLDEAVQGPSGATFYKIYDFDAGGFITAGAPASATLGGWVRPWALDDLNFDGGRYAVKAFDNNAGRQTGFAFGNVEVPGSASRLVRLGDEAFRDQTTVGLDHVINADDLRSADSVKVIVQQGGSTVVNTGFISASDLANKTFGTGPNGTTSNIFVKAFVSWRLPKNHGWVGMSV